MSNNSFKKLNRLISSTLPYEFVYISPHITLYVVYKVCIDWEICL